MSRPIFYLIMINSICVGALNAQSGLNDFFLAEGVRGSITLYDASQAGWISSDKADALRPTLPASTFKIINSLIALQEKVIRPGEVLPWDGKARTVKGKPIPAWNADTDLEGAFKNSTVWFYVELAKQISRETYREYLAKSGYGNLKLNEKGDDFWNYGEFAVSPKNQIDFLVKLYKNELPFSPENMDFVKTLMIQQKTGQYTLRGKTGWTMKDGKEIGWYIGYLETAAGTCFFATRLVAETTNLPATFAESRKRITLAVLSELGFMQ